MVHALLDGLTHDEPVHCGLLGLAYAVDSADRLQLRRWVEDRFDEDDVARLDDV